MNRREFIKIFLGTAITSVASYTVLGPPLRNFFLGRQDASKFKVSVHMDRWLDPVPIPYWRRRGEIVVRGFKKHGFDVSYGEFNTPGNEDLPVVFLWTQPKVAEDARARNVPLLVVERGFVQPRNKFLTFAWNGYNGRGTFAPPPTDDDGTRWEQYFGHHLKPWKTDKSGYTVVMGQRPDVDLVTRNIDINQWAQSVTDTLVARGEKVLFRPHPYIRKKYKKEPEKMGIPKGAILSYKRLSKDLAGAAYCVTFCSNVAVESVLAGVPTVAMDEGSIAWPVTSHNLDEPFFYPDRTAWCKDMSWRHWTLEEVSSGKAWEYVKQVVDLPV